MLLLVVFLCLVYSYHWSKVVCIATWPLTIRQCEVNFYNFKLRLPLESWSEAALKEWVWGEAWAAKSDRTQLGENFIAEQSFAHTLEKDYHLLFGKRMLDAAFDYIWYFFRLEFLHQYSSLPFVAYCNTHRRCNMEKFR